MKNRGGAPHGGAALMRRSLPGLTSGRRYKMKNGDPAKGGAFCGELAQMERGVGA